MKCSTFKSIFLRKMSFQSVITFLPLLVGTYRHFSHSSMQDVCHMNLVRYSGRYRHSDKEGGWGGGGVAVIQTLR